MFEKWNYNIISKSGIGRCTTTTHRAYTISEYDEVYTNLICNTKLGKARR